MQWHLTEIKIFSSQKKKTEIKIFKTSGTYICSCDS